MGMEILHSCDNPPCVNPFHLFMGTTLDNRRDAFRKGRQKPPQPLKKLTPEDVLAIRKSTGTNAAIAAMYGIAPSAVSRIKHRVRWAKLEENS